MQVCHFFATTGCKHPQGCTKGSHDDTLVLPHLESIVCKILAQHGKCSDKHCSKQHFPAVVARYNAEVAKQQPKHNRLFQLLRQPFDLASQLITTPRPASARPPVPCTSLVRAQPPQSSANCSALVAKMQSMGMTASKPEQSKTEVVVKQKRRKTNVVVVLDLSSSMNENIVSKSGQISGSKLDNAKSELNKLWHLLEKGDSLTIITFSNEVSVAMSRRFKWQPKEGQVKRDTQFDEADLRAVVSRLRASGATALYDAVAAALQQTQQACEGDMLAHPNAEWHTYQLLVITDGDDNCSRTSNAASVNNTLLHPGSWAGKSHFSSCFVAIGAAAAAALAPCTAKLKHSVTVEDIDAGFRRLTETVAQVRTTTVQKLKKQGYAYGGGGAKGA